MEYPTALIEERTKKTSGKNEGIGGTPALDIRTNPNRTTIHASADSAPIKVPKREELACLKTPAMANIHIAAHPCERETSVTLTKLSLEQVVNPTVIKVI